MSLAAKAAAVARLEAACVRQREQQQASLQQLKSEFKRSATPVRIVVSGLALGFVAGLRTPKGGMVSVAGQLVGGPLMTSLVESFLPGVVAGLTASLAEGAEAEDEDTADAEDEEPGRADAA